MFSDPPFEFCSSEFGICERVREFSVALLEARIENFGRVLNSPPPLLKGPVVLFHERLNSPGARLGFACGIVWGGMNSVRAIPGRPWELLWRIWDLRGPRRILLLSLLKFNYQSGLRRSQRCNQNQELTKLAREHTPEGRTGNEKRETRNGNEN